MFPGTLLIFIIIIVLDIITKSIKDKKQIERAKTIRKERQRNLDNSSQSTVGPQDYYDSIFTEDNNNKYEETIENRKPVRMDMLSPAVIDFKEVKDSKKNMKKAKNLSGSKNKLKNEIIKGVIYSQILSEPKSLNNMRKSI